MSTRPSTTEPVGGTPEPTSNSPPTVRSLRPWLRTVAAVPHRGTWFTLVKIAFVAGASLCGFGAGTAANIGLALSAATCLVGAALVERLDIAIRDDELRQAERAQEQARQDREDAVAEYGQLVNYTLTPIADVIARMLVTSDRQQRRTLFASVYTLAVEALCDLLPPATRAAYYELADDVVTRVFANGPTTQRARFEPGSPDARAIVRLITRGEFVYVADARANPTVRPSPGSTYRSVIAFSVRTDDRPFGMLTVDSPRVDAFSEKDIATVRVLAKLVASARAALDATVPR
ncbi:MAG TPA: GAF domain-containing protein [Nakamurella sp.]